MFLTKCFESNEIRFVEIADVIYAVGVDVARALGYANPSDAVLKKVYSEYKSISKMATPGGNQYVTCISEPGIYQLIFSSKLKGADKFRRWVFEEVLPNIKDLVKRGYIKELELNKEDLSPCPMFKSLYVAYNSQTNFVKIGISENVDRRINQLETASGCDITLMYKSYLLKDSLDIEAHLLEYFKDYRVKGEWFNLPPEVIVNYILYYVSQGVKQWVNPNIRALELNYSQLDFLGEKLIKFLISTDYLHFVKDGENTLFLVCPALDFTIADYFALKKLYPTA